MASKKFFSCSLFSFDSMATVAEVVKDISKSGIDTFVINSYVLVDDENMKQAHHVEQCDLFTVFSSIFSFYNDIHCDIHKLEIYEDLPF